MIDRITNDSITGLIPGKAGKEVKVEKTTFSDILKNTIKEVNQVQVEALHQMEALALGKVDDIHTPIIAAEKAAITLELLVQVRNKAMDAYQEIMRMQI